MTISLTDEIRYPQVATALPMPVYLLRPELSRSDLGLFLEHSPYKAHYLLSNKEAKDSPALLLGRAFDCAIFEPELFTHRYLVAPTNDRRKKEWKEAAAEAGDREVLNRDQGDFIEGALSSLEGHRSIRRLFGQELEAQVSIFWSDGTLAYKARPDAIIKTQRHRLVIDLKTARSVNPRDYYRSIHEYGYHRQAAHYVDAVRLSMAETAVRFAHVVVEKEPPYEWAVYEFDEDLLEVGRAELRKAKALVARCQKGGLWPSWADRVIAAGVPAYHDSAGKHSFNPFLDEE